MSSASRHTGHTGKTADAANLIKGDNVFMAHSTTITSEQTHLSGLDKALLVLPMLGGFLGLFPLLNAPLFAQLTNYPPDDILIYWLTGAGTLGYGVALALALRERAWAGVRILMIAVLTSNLLSLIACLIEIIQGRDGNHPALYMVLVAFGLNVLISIYLLLRHRGAPRPERDTARWVLYFLIFAIVAALGTGMLGYFAVDVFKPIFGLNAVNPLIYRLLGAATIGYGIAGIFEARSLRFAEIRLSLLMGAFFNVCAIILGILSLVSGLPPLLPITLLFAPVILTIGNALAYARQGK
jgi:uncharacterized membrane protein YuzA (DUF378 family)